MKKIKNILLFVVSAILLSACEKHVIEYDSELIDENATAQFQIYYLVPLATGAANNISKVELDGKLLTNSTTPLNVSNFIPSGATSRFFTTKPGKVNLKLYRGPIATATLAYDMDVDLPAGRYNVVVHDFTKPPVLVEYQTPLPSITTEFTGTTAWIKFSNFLYESAGVPTTLKLQYQFQYTVDNVTGQKSEWANLGRPVSFGESTGWEPVTVNKTVEISQGTARIDYRIRLIGQDGSDQGSLQVRTSSTVATLKDYSDWWNAGIGRVYHHNLIGFRTAVPIAAVASFGVL